MQYSWLNPLQGGSSRTFSEEDNGLVLICSHFPVIILNKKTCSSESEDYSKFSLDMESGIFQPVFPVSQQAIDSFMISAAVLTS